MARDRNPRATKNWELRCETCGHVWPDWKIAQDIRDHFSFKHGSTKLTARLVWVGVGPEPKSQPKVPRWN